MLIEEFKDKFRLRHNDNREPILTWPKGHVYDMGRGDALGVWCESPRPAQTFRAIKSRIPGAKLMQLGESECTFSLPIPSLPVGARHLRSIRTHRRRYRPDLTGRKQLFGRQARPVKAGAVKVD